jgi:hypothetical protein
MRLSTTHGKMSHFQGSVSKDVTTVATDSIGHTLRNSDTEPLRATLNSDVSRRAL